jgi:hypothetical protein
MPLQQERLAAGAHGALNKSFLQLRPGQGCAVSTSRYGASRQDRASAGVAQLALAIMPPTAL